MLRSSVREHSVAFITGAILGYLSLRLPEIGWVGILLVIVAVAAFYISHRRFADVGWLVLGVAAFPTVILGRNGSRALVDPSIEVGTDTWVMLAFFGMLGVAGAVVVILDKTRRRQASPRRGARDAPPDGVPPAGLGH